MTTQVIFKIDKKLKDQAMKKAQNAGMPFGVVLKLATEAYVKGNLEVELSSQPRLNASTRKMLIRELKEIKQGKGLSPEFTTAKQAIDYLKKL